MPALEDALRFGGFVMAHVAWIASDLGQGELVCPIAVVTRDDERRVIPFEAATQAEAVANGKASFAELKHSVDSWALAREGVYSTAGSERRDVLTVSAWVQGLDEPILLQQLFTPNGTGRFALLGPVQISIHGMTLPNELEHRLRPAVLDGIALHPQGARWHKWSSQPTEP